MKNISVNVVSFFYALSGITILLTLLILFFVGTTGFNETSDIVKHVYLESEDNHIFILLTCIMVICFYMAVTYKVGLINTTSRANYSFIVSIIITLISFVLIGGFIGAILLPAAIYSFLFAKQIPNNAFKRDSA